MEPTASPARARILSAAHDLFYRDGIRATGIDRVIAEAGVTKVTFYRHFPSKDDLVRAFLEHRHDLWMGWFVDALGRHGAAGGRPGAGMAALAAALDEWFASPAFRGCAFINTVAELGGTLPDTVAIARRHKAEMADVVSALLPPVPGQGARQVAAHAARVRAIVLTVDGAIVQTQIYGAVAVQPGLRMALLAAAGCAESDRQSTAR